MRPRRLASPLALVLLLASARLPAEALVGAAPDQRFADRVAMVLMRRPGEAGFCSALVLDARTVLTAAHCLRPVRDMAVHYRDASGAPVVIPVEATLAHPQYRPDAIRARVESIDVALVRTARPLDDRFVGARLASGEGPSVGDPVILTGFGATREGDWKSGGALRAVTLTVRAAGLDRSGLGRRSRRPPRGRLFGRLRRADLVRRRRDRRRHRGLGAGAERPRLRRAHPRPEARAAEILDRRGEADAFDRDRSAMS